MSKKPDTASALAGILSAKRGNTPAESTTTVAAAPTTAVKPPSPSPAPLQTPSAVADARPNGAPRARTGKSSDKVNYRQFSVYLRKDTRKKVGRALDDADSEQDFSELVQELLEKWLASRT